MSRDASHVTTSHMIIVFKPNSGIGRSARMKGLTPPGRDIRRGSIDGVVQKKRLMGFKNVIYPGMRPAFCSAVVRQTVRGPRTSVRERVLRARNARRCLTGQELRVRTQTCEVPTTWSRGIVFGRMVSDLYPWKSRTYDA